MKQKMKEKFEVGDVVYYRNAYGNGSLFVIEKIYPKKTTTISNIEPTADIRRVCSGDTHMSIFNFYTITVYLEDLITTNFYAKRKREQDSNIDYFQLHTAGIERGEEISEAHHEQINLPYWWKPKEKKFYSIRREDRENQGYYQPWSYIPDEPRGTIVPALGVHPIS